MGSGWNPWRALRARPHLRLIFDYLPEGCGGGRLEEVDGERTVVLDHRLDRRTRRCVLGHELVHDERGILYHPSSPELLVAKEESYVTREATVRLVPLDQLAAMAERCEAEDEPLHAVDVAEEFDVDLPTAHRALALLEMRWGR